MGSVWIGFSYQIQVFQPITNDSNLANICGKKILQAFFPSKSKLKWMILQVAYHDASMKHPFIAEAVILGRKPRYVTRESTWEGMGHLEGIAVSHPQKQP